MPTSIRTLRIALLQPKLSWRGRLINIRTIDNLIDKNIKVVRQADICVLPECWFRSLDRQAYEQEALRIQKKLKTALVAGSHHEEDRGRLYNRGVVLDKQGKIVARYGKLHPFGREVKEGVKRHPKVCEFSLGDIRAAVMICADFFYSRVFHKLHHQPDIVFVPAESVSSSTNDPRYGRALWQHTAVARAYEFTSFMAISDWATSRETRTCGVTGFADPAAQDEEPFYLWAGEGESVLLAKANLERLKTHRRSRRSMSFFWR